MDNMFNFNKVVLITGASRGIGRRIAYELAVKGYTVIANCNKSGEAEIELEQEVNKKGKQIEIYKADVSQRDQVREMVQYVINKYGKIDVLINNAGISQTKLFTDLTDEDWETMLRTNLYSVFYATQEVVKNMLMYKEGCIINMSSVWGMIGGSMEVHYSVAKAGMDGLTKALAKELGPSNIRVNSIAPGIVDTDMNSDLTDEELKDIEKDIPLGRIGQPIDISRCVEWLIEDKYTTGQVISPNGGWVIV